MPSTYKYAYPNWKSYQMIPSRPGVGLYNGQLLRHGYIYGYKDVTTSYSSRAESLVAAAQRQLDYSNVMVFQFNPSNLPITVSMMNVDNAENENPEGNLPTPAVGLAESVLELMFDRTNEIARATMRRPGRYGETKFRELGVQVDLFDLLKVMSGGKKSDLMPGGEDEVSIGDPDAQPVIPGSTNYLTGKMFDSVTTGAKMYFHAFAVVFNQNLAIHVNKLKSFAFTYTRFTADLVPTTMNVQLGLEIMNMGTKQFVTSGGAAGPSTPADTTTTTGAPPGVATATPTGVVNATGTVPSTVLGTTW